MDGTGGMTLREVSQSEKDHYRVSLRSNIRSSRKAHRGREGKLSGRKSERRQITRDSKQTEGGWKGCGRGHGVRG